MKKSLLFFLAISSVLSGAAFQSAPNLLTGESVAAPLNINTSQVSAYTRAEDESYMFSYDSGLYTAYRFQGPVGGKSRVYLSFQLAPEEIKAFAGAKVTGFAVYSPTNSDISANSIVEGQFFCSNDLKSASYAQDFSFSKNPFAYNMIELDNPYVITGDEETLFFGYNFLVPKLNNMYYAPVDGIPGDEGSGILGYSDDEGTFPVEYSTFGEQYGALCMSIKIERADLPLFSSFYSYPETFLLPKGKDSSIPVSVKVLSPNSIESVDFNVTFTGQSYASHYALPEVTPAGEMALFNALVDIKAVDEKVSGPLNISITKLNGKSVDVDEVLVDAMVVERVPVHQTLLEEYTGVGCGWCTRGYAALEYIKKNEPDFVVAAYHSSMFGTDAMSVITSFPVSVSGLPYMSLNRIVGGDPYYGTETYGGLIPIVEEVKAMNALPSFWGIEVSHNWIDDNTLKANASVWNAVGYDNDTYKIAYILVTDGLSGSTSSWTQNNYYYQVAQSTNYVEELNKFCIGGEYGTSKVVGLEYNDVVISSTGIKGVSGSIPSSLKANEEVSHSIAFDLSKIKAALLPDKNKLRVIAMVLDKNGQVLNCAKNEVNDYDEFVAAVEGISDENAPVEYYNLNGMKISEPTQGIVIRRQGSKAEKIIIR